jgi:hexosaminidase
LKSHCPHCLVHFGLLSSLFLAQGVARCQEAPLPLMPQPAHVVMGEEQFAVDGSLGVEIQGYSDGRLVSGKKRFLNILYRETGIPVEGAFEPRQANFVIKTAGAGAPVQRLGENESYRLEVSKAGVLLTAPNPLGVLHGLQTFLQLVRLTPQGFVAPVVTIDDEPRFPWRGLMIDSGRHFIPLPVILRNLDGMEAVKMNVFHWHLSDDQGFRVESKVFPLLQGKGSNGLFYTQKQVSEVVQYAKERGIRVVPEFDMPCHTTSWLAGYPQLASGKGPYQISDRWGVMDAAIDPAREGTYQFLDKFIGEMAVLFPDAYFHIGGDECDGKEWDANPRIKAFMRAHGMKDNAALQSYFTARVQKLVAGHHKIMEGWDEVLQADTPRDVVIQSWRGEKALAVAARQGNRVLLSNGYYIDLNQPAAEHYLVDPLAGDGDTLTPEQKARVLGGEATMWSEYATGENIDSRIWPRTAAIAERLWSPKDVRDIASMYERLAVVSQKLQDYGLEHELSPRLMLERIGGGVAAEPLKVLAAVVQPPRGYARGGMREYHTFTPLNRLTDAVPPESETARKFNALVQLIVAGKATPKQWQEARDWLVLWRDNDAKLQPMLGASDLAAELVPVSHDLAIAAGIGLKALDDLENHRASNADQSMETLEGAAKPQAVLLDMVVPPVQLLVKAAGAQK